MRDYGEPHIDYTVVCTVIIKMMKESTVRADHSMLTWEGQKNMMSSYTKK